MKTCQACGYVNLPEAKFCVKCGVRMPEPKPVVAPPPPEQATGAPAPRPDPPRPDPPRPTPVAPSVSPHLPGTARVKVEKSHFAERTYLSLIIGGVFTFLFFLLLTSPAGKSIFPQALIIKLTERGWTQYASVFLSFWTLSILSLKLFSIIRRRRLLRADLIPDQAGFATPAEIQQAIDGTAGNARRLRDPILGPRICRALEHYLATRSIKETGDVLREEGDADFVAMHSTYAPVRVFLWTIPILGFIGTVMGVSDAVAKFAGFLREGAKEIDQIKSALTGVTDGLAVAFDTTYVALVLTVILMILMSGVEKLEQDQLNGFEDYCKERLLRRLSAQAAPAGLPGVPDDFVPVATQLAAALEGLKESVANAPQNLRQLAVSLVPDIDTWRSEAQNLARTLSQTLEQSWKDAGQEVIRTILTLREESVQTQQGLRKSLEDDLKGLVGALNQHHGMLERFVTFFQELGTRVVNLMDMQNHLEATLAKVSGSDGLAAVMGDLSRTLKTLDPAVQRLASKPLEVDVHFVSGAVKA